MEDLLAYLARALVDEPDAGGGRVVRGGRRHARVRAERRRGRRRQGHRPRRPHRQRPAHRDARVRRSSRAAACSSTSSIDRPDRPLPAGRVGTRARPRRQLLRRTRPSTLDEGDAVMVGGPSGRSSAAAAPTDRPLIRAQRDRRPRRRRGAARRAHLLVGRRETSPEDEWHDDDLVGCEVPGSARCSAVLHGAVVRRARAGRRHVLVPLISDAVTRRRPRGARDRGRPRLPRPR